MSCHLHLKKMAHSEYLFVLLFALFQVSGRVPWGFFSRVCIRVGIWGSLQHETTEAGLLKETWVAHFFLCSSLPWPLTTPLSLSSADLSELVFTGLNVSFLWISDFFASGPTLAFWVLYCGTFASTVPTNPRLCSVCGNVTRARPRLCRFAVVHVEGSFL